MNDTSDLLSVKQAAAYLGITDKSVRRHIREGNIPVLRLGEGEHAPIRIYEKHLAGWISKSTKTHNARKRNNETEDMTNAT